jgi:PAS domain S-box-containing protein
MDSDAPPQPLRVLLAEDSQDDAELVLAELRWQGVQVATRIVTGAAAFADALGAEAWDLVISDFNLPGFSALDLLDLLRRADRDTPVIVVSAFIGDEAAAAIIKAGAYDFVAKSNLKSLPGAVRRAVREAQVNRERAAAQRALAESEERFRSLSALASDWFWETDAEHRFVDTPARLTAITGMTAADYVGKRRWEVAGLAPVHGDWSAHRQVIARRETYRNLELVQDRADGSRRYLQVSGEPFFGSDGEFKGYRGSGRDVTDAVRHAEELRRFRLALDNSADMILLVDRATMRYVDVNDSACRLLGYSRAELLEMGPQDLFPVSRAELERAYDALIARPDLPSGINSQYRCKDGSLLPFESSRQVMKTDRGSIIIAIARDIRERIATENALRRSEERFRKTFDLAGSGVSHVGLDGRFLRVNRKLCELLGYASEELCGKNVKEISHPEDRHIADAARARMHAGETDAVRIEKRYRRKDGSTLWVDLTISLDRDANGAPLYEISILDDITERKQLDQALRESETRFRSLTALSSDWYWETDAEHRFCGTPAQLTAITGWTATHYVGRRRWEVEGLSPMSGDWSEHQQALDRRQPYRDLKLRQIASDGSHHYIRTSGEPVFDASGAFKGYRGTGTDITREVELEQMAREADRRLRYALNETEASIALWDQDHRLVLWNKKFGRRSFARGLVRQGLAEEELIRVAAYSGQVLEARGCEEEWIQQRLAGRKEGHAEYEMHVDDRCILVTYQRLADGSYISFMVDITERKKVEEALRESEARFRSLNALSSDWYWETDREHRFLSSPKGKSRLTGHPASFYLGKRRWEVEGLAPLSGDWSAHQTALERHEAFRSLKLSERHPAGGVAFLQINGEPVFDAAGEFKGYRGTGRDITHEVELEQQAHDAERSKVALLANLPGYAYRCRNDAAWTLLYASEGVARITGYSADELVTARTVTYANLMHPEDSRLCRAAAEAALAKREPFEFEYRLRTRNGEERWVWERGQGVFSVTGELLHLEGFIADATERKHAEQRLAESESRFFDFARASGDWFWETDEANRFTWISEKLKDATGHSPERYYGKERTDVGAAGSEHSMPSWRSHRETLKRRDAFRDFRYRMTHADGREIWISTSGVPRFDVRGRFLGYRGVAMDVTREVELERQAREANERLKSALDQSDAAIALWDKEDRLFLWNRNFANRPSVRGRVRAGLSAEDMIRMAAYSGRIPEAQGREEEWATERIAQRSLGRTQYEMHLDGRCSLVNNQRLADGSRMTLILDVTEQKRVEEALRAAEERYRNFIVHSGDAIFRFEHREPVPITLPPAELIERILAVAVLAESNPVHARIYGFPDQESMLGMPLEFFGGREENRLFLDNYVNNGFRVHGFEWSERINGERRWFRGSVVGTVREGMLTGAWGTQTDITERKRAESEIVRSREQLRQLAEHFDRVKEEERASIAREIHDEMGGLLTAAKIELSGFAQFIPPERLDLFAGATTADALLDQAMDMSRRIARRLRPAILDYGIVAAIEWQARDFSRRLGIPCELIVETEEPELEPERATAVFRIFQESLTNVARHARATRVRVELDTNPDEGLTLRVADDGVGIDTGNGETSTTGTFGVLGMRERAKFLGGELTLARAREGGTEILLRLPLPDAAAHNPAAQQIPLEY